MLLLFKNLLLQNNNISVSIVKNSYQILVYFFQFIMNQMYIKDCEFVNINSVKDVKS